MLHYTTIHLHNTPAGKEAEYASSHGADLARLRCFKGADRYEVTPEQIMPDIPQPWRYISITISKPQRLELTHRHWLLC
jgi:hypothetical protein